MKQTFFKLLTALLGLSLLAQPTVASDADLLNQLDQVRQQQAIYSQQQGDLQQQSELSTQGLADLRGQLAKQHAAVTASAAKLEATTARLAVLKRQRGLVMQQSYMTNSDASLLYAMIQSGTLSEALSKGQYTSFLLDRKTDLLDQLDSTINDLDHQRQDLVTVQNAYDNQIHDLERRLAEVEAALAANKSNQDAAAALEAALSGATGNYNHNDRSWIKNNEPIGGVYTFVGGGTEHGLGMSQYGAKGAADHGKNYRDIITHYYTGATVGTVSDNPSVNVGGDMETYLVGVVEAEMNSNWPMEALKAQAVAARSYAYMNRNHLDNSPRTQAWVGPGQQTARARQAVAETRGQVVMFAGQVVAAYFHSTSGGWTENNENVWGGRPLTWLRGVSSPWETDSPHWEWRTKSYSREQMQAIVNGDGRTAVGELQTVKIVGRGVSGRVTSVTIVGSAGSKTVSGPTFKSIFNSGTPGDDPILRSTLYAFI